MIKRILVLAAVVGAVLMAAPAQAGATGQLKCENDPDVWPCSSNWPH